MVLATRKEAMRIVYESAFLRIQHDAAFRTLELEWLDFANSEQVRMGMLEGLGHAHRLHARAWIGNLKRMRVIRPQDQQWIYETWFPRFAQLGIRRLAIVESDDKLNRMGVAQIMQHAVGSVPLATAYFQDVEAARTWASRYTNDTLPVLLEAPAVSYPGTDVW